MGGCSRTEEVREAKQEHALSVSDGGRQRGGQAADAAHDCRARVGADKRQAKTNTLGRSPLQNTAKNWVTSSKVDFTEARHNPNFADRAKPAKNQHLSEGLW